MSHLTDQQFEDVLQGAVDRSEHLQECSHCSARFGESQAIRGRLQKAFDGVHAGEPFVEKLRASIRKDLGAAGHAGRAKTVRFPSWRVGLPVAAVAAILVAVGFFLTAPGGGGTPRFAQTALANIHMANIGHDANQVTYRHERSPAAAAKWFRANLGYEPRMPNWEETSLEAVSLGKIQGKPVGSYILEGRDGKLISIIVTRLSPRTLNFDIQRKCCDHVLYACSQGGCQMVAMEIDGVVYTAVGEVGHNRLSNVLLSLSNEN